MAVTTREAVIGLRARTARAIVVALAEGETGVEIVHRGEIATWDPDLPESSQPHHAGLGMSAAEARPVVRKAERAVRRAAVRALRALLADLARTGVRGVGVGVVGPPVKDPSRIGNEHVRAHAAEGQLFRDVLSEAASARELPHWTLSDRSAWDDCAARMHCEPAALRRQTTGLGQLVGPPWRADEKLACLAALWVLSER